MPDATSITVLVENTANQRGLLAEHGLAFWIERGGRRILLDTGQGLALTHNAGQLGVELSAVDDVVLSHGHYDHTGGLLAALPAFNRVTVYAHLTAFRERFARHPRTGVRPVGSPVESIEWLKPRVGQVVSLWTRPVDLGAGVWATGQIPRQNDFEGTGGDFYFDAACTQPDPIVDDQALYMETGNGLLVLVGCAHAGVVNTLDYVCTLTGEDRIFAVLGGMHLLNADEHRLDRTIRRLRELEVQRIGLAHCTGFAAMARLYQALPGRCFHCVTGTQLEFGGNGDPGVHTRDLDRSAGPTQAH